MPTRPPGSARHGAPALPRLIILSALAGSLVLASRPAPAQDGYGLADPPTIVIGGSGRPAVELNLDAIDQQADPKRPPRLLFPGVGPKGNQPITLTPPDGHGATGERIVLRPPGSDGPATAGLRQPPVFDSPGLTVPPRPQVAPPEPNPRPQPSGSAAPARLTPQPEVAKPAPVPPTAPPARPELAAIPEPEPEPAPAPAPEMTDEAPTDPEFVPPPPISAESDAARGDDTAEEDAPASAPPVAAETAATPASDDTVPDVLPPAKTPANEPPPPPAVPTVPVESAALAVPAEETAPAAGTQTAALPPRTTSVEGGVRITFKGGSAALPADAAEALDEIVATLNEDQKRRVKLSAYAAAIDEDPSDARRLSLSRALAVRTYLMDNGVRSTRMDVRALGDRFEQGPADRVDVTVTAP